MIYFLSESEKKTAIKEYAGRQKTIRQLAQKYGVLYEIMRRIMVNAGYSNGLKVIIPELSEPPVRTLGATIPENESHIFR